MTPTNEKSREDWRRAQSIASGYLPEEDAEGNPRPSFVGLAKAILQALATAREDERRRIVEWLKGHPWLEARDLAEMIERNDFEEMWPSEQKHNDPAG